MTDKVQKIREEVEKLHGNPYYMMAVKDVLEILNMQEEPVSKEIGDYDHKAVMESLHLELKEEPVSEGRDIFDNCLKSEEKFILPQKISGNIDCENCLYSSACALGDIQTCIIDKPVSEDLGEYINELSKQFPEVSFAKLSRIAVRVAKWKEQQLMAKAVDVTVHIDNGNYSYIPQIELYDYDKDIPLA